MNAMLDGTCIKKQRSSGMQTLSLQSKSPDLFLQVGVSLTLGELNGQIQQAPMPGIAALRILTKVMSHIKLL